MKPWDVYQPSDTNPWDLRKVGHLYRRAGFGASWRELHESVKAGPKATIDMILAGRKDPDFEESSEFMASERSLPAGAANQQLAAWWLYRMLRSPHPLAEKLTLFWHNHFATSITKVQNARMMLGQYRLMYRHALGRFDELLQEMTLDPAMMIWLDTKDSKKGKPNENYARELMELFSLGIGHYTETDIREAAKAFTGYDLKNGESRFSERDHDASTKRVLGKTGAFRAKEIVDICLDQPSCPRFIVSKLYRFLISETESPPSELIDPLAQQYRASGFDTGKLVATILRSNLFFSEVAYRAKVKSPVEFTVGIVRALNGNVGPLALAQAIEPLGQVLFAPPSVKGWDGGATWLNAQTLLFRQNLALALTSTSDARFGKRCDPAAILKPDESCVTQLLDLFLQGDVPGGAREKLMTYWKESQNAKYPPFWSAEDIVQHRLRTVTHLTLTLPEFQLN